MAMTITDTHQTMPWFVLSPFISTQVKLYILQKESTLWATAWGQNNSLNEDYLLSEIWVFKRHHDLLRMDMWNFKSFTVILYYNVAIMPKSFENVANMPKSCIFMPMSNFWSMFLCLSHFLLYCEILQERYYVILNWITFTPDCVEN